MKRSWALLGLLFAAGCSAFGGTGRELGPGGDSSASAWIESDQRTVLIYETGGACDESAEVKVRETPEVVEIAVTIHSSDGECIMLGVPRTYEAVLREPLGSRRLVSGNGIEYPRAAYKPPNHSGEYKIPVTVERED